MTLLKFKKQIAGILLVSLLVLSSTILSDASQPAGCIDSIDGNSISGWAWNSSTPETPLSVRITIKNRASGVVVQELSATASYFREDLSAISQGTGYYGFQAATDWSEFEEGYYLVEAFAGQTPLSNPLVYSTISKETVAYTTGLRSLGVFKTTAYCPCRICTNGTRRTSTGTIPAANHTIAVDPRVIPYGTKVMINGIVYTAEDRGGAVKGNHIDIYFNTHQEACQWGRKQFEVYVLP